MKIKKYVFYEDGGHGWLKVSKKELAKLGIENQITGFSHMLNDFAYLEEDCDLTTFFEALAKANNVNVEDVNSLETMKFRQAFWANVERKCSDKLSKIRNYNSYEVFSETVLTKMNEFKALMLSTFRFGKSGINRVKNGNLKDCKYWNDYYHLNFKFE